MWHNVSTTLNIYRREPVPEETFTHLHLSWSSSLICFTHLHVLRSMASSLFNPYYHSLFTNLINI